MSNIETVQSIDTPEVWISYDPAYTDDSAAYVVIMAPPQVVGGKFRKLVRYQWKGLDLQAQSDAIQKLGECYHISHISVNTTGIGQACYDLIKQWFPAVIPWCQNCLKAASRPTLDLWSLTHE